MSRSVGLLRVSRSDRGPLLSPVVDQEFDGVVSQQRLVSENDERGARGRRSTGRCEGVEPTSDGGGEPLVGIRIGDQLESRGIEVPAQSSVVRPHDCHSACQEAVRHGLSHRDSHVGNQRSSVKPGKEFVAAEA